jgi:hypothetical protein
VDAQGETQHKIVSANTILRRGSQVAGFILVLISTLPWWKFRFGMSDFYRDSLWSVTYPSEQHETWGHPSWFERPRWALLFVLALLIGQGVCVRLTKPWNLVPLASMFVGELALWMAVFKLNVYSYRLPLSDWRFIDVVLPLVPVLVAWLSLRRSQARKRIPPIAILGASIWLGLSTFYSRPVPDGSGLQGISTTPIGYVGYALLLALVGLSFAQVLLSLRGTCVRTC